MKNALGRSTLLTLRPTPLLALMLAAACQANSGPSKSAQSSTAISAANGGTANSLGCFRDSDNRDLPYLAAFGEPTNTTESCVRACASAGYAYAGTQYSDECWCGN